MQVYLFPIKERVWGRILSPWRVALDEWGGRNFQDIVFFLGCVFVFSNWTECFRETLQFSYFWTSSNLNKSKRKTAEIDQTTQMHIKSYYYSLLWVIYSKNVYFHAFLLVKINCNKNFTYIYFSFTSWQLRNVWKWGLPLNERICSSGSDSFLFWVDFF